MITLRFRSEAFSPDVRAVPVPSGFEGAPGGRAIGDDIICKIRYYLDMKKLQPGDKIVKVDKELGIAWILLPPDTTLGGFQGISPRIMDEEKFISAKKKAGKK
ncbi:MAG TPA: hypothetical protein VK568_04940 [Thermodesulfobacteriota bacterium]|nr:hypothetical protein [Thermodesulfobacteriota bacterium]